MHCKFIAKMPGRNTDRNEGCLKRNEGCLKSLYLKVSEGCCKSTSGAVSLAHLLNCFSLHRHDSTDMAAKGMQGYLQRPR
jgi:hypothetical protein